MVVRTWRHLEERYNMVGTKCETCGSVFFPSRNVCPKCRRKGVIKPYKLSGKGKVYSFSKISAPPEEFEIVAPYVIGIIELEEGPKITSQIDEDYEKISIGMPVKATFRKISEEGKEGVIKYGYKFIPINE